MFLLALIFSKATALNSFIFAEHVGLDQDVSHGPRLDIDLLSELVTEQLLEHRQVVLILSTVLDINVLSYHQGQVYTK